MKVNFFKLQRNKRFNYTPRYYEGKEKGNIYDLDSPFHKFREGINTNDYSAQWKRAREENRTKANRDFNLRIVIIAAVLILIFLALIGFDLSIFSTFY